MKGGAMFFAAIWHYLRGNSYPDIPRMARWEVLVVLDEGILNTDNYSPVREFLRTPFTSKRYLSHS